MSTPHPRQQSALRLGITREDATKRAIEDHSQSEQYSRLSAQYIIIANAGAAGAMLTFLTAVMTATTLRQGLQFERLINWLCISAGFYLLGALICLFSIIIQAQAKRYWGYLWEEQANFADDDGFVQPDFGHHFARIADRLDSLARITMILSALMFLPGSIAAITSFVG